MSDQKSTAYRGQMWPLLAQTLRRLSP